VHAACERGEEKRIDSTPRAKMIPNGRNSGTWLRKEGVDGIVKKHKQVLFRGTESGWWKRVSESVYA